jgi:ABC-type multidrug transport system ATPase subunit
MVADSMIILHKGEKVVEGKVSQLLDPSRTLVKIETNNTKSAIQIISESQWAQHLVSNDSLSFEMNKNNIPLLIKFLVEHEISVENIKSNHSLENYFLQLTNS